MLSPQRFIFRAVRFGTLLGLGTVPAFLMMNVLWVFGKEVAILRFSEFDGLIGARIVYFLYFGIVLLPAAIVVFVLPIVAISLLIGGLFYRFGSVPTTKSSKRVWISVSITLYVGLIWFFGEVIVDVEYDDIYEYAFWVIGAFIMGYSVAKGMQLPSNALSTGDNPIPLGESQ